jgi:hypothetical protein
LMDDAKVPESRRASCIEEAARKQKTWNALLRPHRRRDADPDFPGDLPADAPGGKVTVEYGPMNSAFARVMGPVLKQAHLFENLAGIATKLYVLPRDTKIIVRDCDEANCWYSEDDGSVTICYSMMKLVLDLVHQHEGGQTGAPPPPVATPTPKPKPAPQSVDLPHFLTGTWFSQTTNALGFAETRAMLNADGTYLAQESIRMSSGGFVVITARGRWSAQPMGGNRFTMTQVPFEWTPRQICQAPGYCQPLTLGRVTEVITIVDRNTMRTQAGQINRVTPPEE